MGATLFEPKKGTQILNYRIIRLIGAGGMAKVYEAEHINLGTKVAVKVLDPVLASKGNLKERFRNEARIMATLKHENIVQVLDYYEDDATNTFAIVMELLEGETLSDFINRNGALSEEHVYDIMAKTLKAFGFAHGKGLIHRDVKPANIFITKDKNIKILDFGIAKIIGQNAELTGTGMQMGTPMYMSPEQVKDSKHLDHRSDIYSLGVMMYFMLTGNKPYNTNTDSSFDILNKIVNEPLPLITGSKFNNVIQKTTAKATVNRYQDCAEFIYDLHLDTKNSNRTLNYEERDKIKENNNYAGFVRQLGALIIDIIFAGLIYIIIYTFVIITDFDLNLILHSNSIEIFLFSIFFIPFAFVWLYFSISENSKKMATWGMLILGIKVKKLQEERMSYYITTIRLLFRVVSIVIPILLLMPLFTKKKQFLQDIVTNTIVIKH